MTIGDWSDKLARLLGIRTITIGEGQRGLLYREQRAVRVLQPGVTRLFGQHQPLDLRICSIANPVYSGRDAEQLIESMEASIRRAFVVIETEADEVARVSIDGRIVAVLAPDRRKLLWRIATAPVVDRMSCRGSPTARPAPVPPSEDADADADAMVTLLDVPERAAAPALADGWPIAMQRASRPAFWARARTFGVGIVAPRPSRAAASSPVIERKAA